MGEVIKFVSKAERERIRLIEEARAMYDSVFPSAEPDGEKRAKSSASPAAKGAAAVSGDGFLWS